MKKPLLVPVLAIGLLGLFATPALASPKTFYVHPSGGNDTHNIQAAFNAAVKAGPGSTVELGAGHFYTNTVLVKNFDGYFRGAGEGQTVIDCLRGLDPSLPGVTVMPAIVYFPFLVGFDGGDVRASDMSFDITPFHPAEPWDNGDPANLADLLMVTVLVTGNASSSFDHVSFTAGAGNDSGYDTDEGIVVEGLGQLTNYVPTTLWETSGVDSICGCSFTGPPDGVQVLGLTKGRATITGNVFDDSDFACMFNDSSASQVTVSHNQMSSAWWDDIVLWQGFQAGFGAGAPLPSLPAPHYLITDNHVLATTYAGGVEVRDDSPLYSAPNRLAATIADNNISLDNDGWDGGIDGVYAKGVRVSDNHISGTGLAGIDVGAVASLWGMQSAPDSGWQLINNDVSHLTLATQYTDASGAPVWGAPIWLGPDADHCLVVGGKAPTQVLDQGTDDTLINVTQLPLPASASASSIGQAKRVLMKEVLP